MLKPRMMPPYVVCDVGKWNASWVRLGWEHNWNAVALYRCFLWIIGGKEVLSISGNVIILIQI